MSHHATVYLKYSKTHAGFNNQRRSKGVSKSNFSKLMYNTSGTVPSKFTTVCKDLLCVRYCVTF